MAFDPSVLQDIQPPDIVGGIAKGYQLKDMVDTQQLNTLKLNSEKATLAEDEAANKIMKAGDMSTDQGRAKIQEQVNKVSPRRAMELGKYSQSVQSGELAEKLGKVELHGAAQDLIAGGIDKIWQQATAMKNEKTPDGRPKYTEASVNAWIQGQIPVEVSAIQSDSGLPEDVKKMALGNIHNSLGQSGGAITYDQLTQFERGSKQGQAQIKSMRDDLIAQTGAKREGETERHNQTMEELAARKTTDMETKQAAVTQARASFTGRNGDLMAALAERGISLPAGFRAKEQQIALLEGLWKRNPEASADDIAAKIQTGQLSFGNAKTEGRVAAGVAGKVTYAEHELEQTIPLVREASAKLPRGQFIPWTKLKQMGERATSSPELAEFNMYMTSLSNAYDMLAARGGTDAEKRKESRHNFDTAASPEALEGVLRAVQQEAQASGRAADESMADAAGRGNPKSPTSPAGAVGAGAAPTKILRYDAQGKPVS